MSRAPLQLLRPLEGNRKTKSVSLQVKTTKDDDSDFDSFVLS